MEALKPIQSPGEDPSSSRLTPSQIDAISAQLREKDIVSLTLDFEDSDFIYFGRIGEDIKYVRGDKKEYLKLKQALHVAHQPQEDPKSHEKEKKDTEMQLIHQSLFTPHSTFEQFFKKAEVFFEPFEAPGGDFYWCKNYPYKTLIIVGDCTGHGIQGTMVAMSILTLIKHHFRLLPNLLSKEISDIHDEINSLRESGDNSFLDCELGLVLVDRRTHEADYIGSGVNMIRRNGEEVDVFSGRKTRLLMGKQTVSHFRLNEGDELYLFTDGITDQFDSENERKLGLRGMQELIRSLPAEPELKDFEAAFSTFRGSTASLDDQTLLMLSL